MELQGYCEIYFVCSCKAVILATVVTCALASEMVIAGATVTKHNYAGRCHKRKLIT